MSQWQMNILQNKGIFNKNLRYLLHIFICSIGLLGIIFSYAGYLGEELFNQTLIGINNYLLESSFHPEKRYELLKYFLATVFLLIYYIATYLISLWCSRKKVFFFLLDAELKKVILYLLISLVANFSLIRFLPHFTYWVVFIWVLFFLLPLCPCITKFQWSSRIFCSDYLLLIVLIFVLFNAVHMFYPFVFDEIRIMNEYLDIPEKTFLEMKDNKNSLNEIQLVDNTDYINKHSLIGFYPKYDVEEGYWINNFTTYGLEPYLKINKEMTPSLMDYLEKKNFHSSLFYDDRTRTLGTTGQLSQEELIFLKNSLGNQMNNETIDKLFFNAAFIQQYMNNREYSKEEEDFLDKNKFEYNWQISNRGIIHHLNFILGPINEYTLGKDINTLFMQYGWLNMVFIKKILELTGGISYQNYFKVWYSFYYFYYFIFLIILYLYFKRIDYIVLTTILSFTALNLIGYQFTFMAPGSNPIRHFFDILVFITLAFYFCKMKFIYLITASSLAVLGVLNNTQFGIFTIAAMSGALIIRSLIERKFVLTEIFIVICTGIVGIYLFLWGRIGQDPLTQYYLNGMLGIGLGTQKLLKILILYSFAYIVLFKNRHSRGYFKYMALFLLFYSQELMIYYVWMPQEDHFLSMAPIYSLTFISILKLLFDNSIKNVKIHRWIIITMIMLALIEYIPSLEKYNQTKKEYDRVFSSHVIYQWDFNRAKIKTTMNPKYFLDAVNLINKYTINNDIYIISKYDAIVPFLANKYSAMPFFELSQFLISDKEIEQAIVAIQQASPEYIFVDTDINRPLNTDIVNSRALKIGWLHKESLWRAQRLSLLKNIFQSVEYEYEPIEKGYLITVYKKKY